MESQNNDNGGTASDDVAETFFATVKPPNHFQDSLATIDSFLLSHENGSYPVVLVTSGGTIVPLERQMVRFLDNFSAGSRGAISAEWFLRKGCAVIFLHRQFSLRPFARHYRHADELVLDIFNVEDALEEGKLTIKKAYQPQILSDIHACHDRYLVAVHFYTVSDYLFLLQAISQRMAKLDCRALIYLAAAVSDFYLPESRLSNHKIQSDEGALLLKLEPVPKVIRPMVVKWCPRAFIVSFKLETDPRLLLGKARQALVKYQHDLVIANLLSERKWRVTLVHRQISGPDGEIPDRVIECNQKNNSDKEIEEEIVNYLLYLLASGSYRR